MKAKRILAILLAGVLGIGTFAFPAAAIDGIAGPAPVYDGVPADSISDGSDAIAELMTENTDTVYLTENETNSSTEVIFEEHYEYPCLPADYSIAESLAKVRDQSGDEFTAYLASSDRSDTYIYYIKRRCGSDANFQAMDQAATAIVNMMDSNWTTLDKVIFVNDYLTSTKQYDTSKTKYSAYNLLVENTAVCQGYAEAVWYIMYKLGIDCKIVCSTQINHAWNLVMVDGSWYQLDVTWNDPLKDVEGRSMHNHMLCSDTEFLSTHSATDWNFQYESGASAYNYAISTKYDNYFWKNVRKPLIIKNNGYYYLNGNNIAFANKDNISTNICDITARWPVWGESYSYWNGNYSGLINVGQYLIYNDAKNIYACDLNGNNITKLYTLTSAEQATGYIYNLINDGSSIRYRLAQDPYVDPYTDGRLSIASLADPVTPKLTVTPGSGCAYLSWGAVANATRYRTFYCLSGTYNWVSSGDLTSTTSTVTGLTNGVTYDFLVLAGNASTFSSWNNSDIVTVTIQGSVPVTPKLTVTPGSGCAYLSWNAVANATRYRTFYCPSGTYSWVSSGDITSTSSTITGLTGGVKYDFLVLAGNASTFSAWSNSDIVSATPSYSAVPVTPKLTVKPGNGCASLSWNTAANATRYRTFYRRTGTAAWTSSGDLHTTSNTINGLTNGQNYDFLVLAGNNSTFSSWSNSDIVVAAPAAPVPETPSLSVTASDSAAYLSWIPVENATRYRTFYRVSGTNRWVSSGDLTVSSNIVRGLSNGVKYDFLVLAGNNSTFSAWDTTDIVASTPRASSSVPSTPRLTVVPGRNSAYLSWNYSSSATRYRTFYCISGTNRWVSSGDLSTTSNTITGLTNGQKYDFLVLAGNNSTFSSWTRANVVTAAPTASPAIPATPTISVSTFSNKAFIYWSPVANATRYRAFYCVSGTNQWVSSVDLDSTRFFCTELQSGVTYDFLVLAGNDYTFSSWSRANVVVKATS